MEDHATPASDAGVILGRQVPFSDAEINAPPACDAALYQAKSRGRDRVAINHAGGVFGDAIVDLKEGR